MPEHHHGTPIDTDLERKSTMTSERIKEIRAWGTLILIFTNTVAIPVGFLVLHNQRLEIMQDVNHQLESYVTTSYYRDDSAKMSASMGELKVQLGEVKGQIGAVLLEQAHMSDAVSALKERVNDGRQSP